MTDSLKNFIEWLKEETLPGVWSKGIQLSRASKSIERLSDAANERKYKLQTTERTLAYQVTLWLTDLDSHCNCGSKIEPCHHIVAVALAEQNGLVKEANLADSDDSSAARLVYTWVIDIGGHLKLQREVSYDHQRTPLTTSLVGLIGGVQSGRIKSPVPPASIADLKIDEVLAKNTIQWTELLKAAHELPPFAVHFERPSGVLTKIQFLRSNPKDRKKVLRIEDAPHGFSIRADEADRTPILKLKNGLGIFYLGNETAELAFDVNAVVSGIQYPASVPAHPSRELETFLLQTLPKLKEEYSVEVLATQLPAIVPGDPRIEFKMQSLGEETLALTPILSYGPALPNTIYERDLDAEQELTKNLRRDFQFAVNQTVKLDASQVLQLREKPIAQNIMPELDGFLKTYLRDLATHIDLSKVNKESILRLFQLKKESPQAAHVFTQHLRQQLGIVASPVDEIPLAIPRSLWERLRDYQRQGVHWLADHIQNKSTGAILADDMGLGKTVQTLSILQKPALVIVPTSLIHNWETEVAQFRPDLTTQTYHSTPRKFREDTDLTITTYGILRQEPERFLGRTWGTVVLDEAHLIRNADTQVSSLCLQLTAHFKIALTGTPIQNKARDLFTLFEFIAPGQFDSEFALKKEWIAPYLLRRTKSEVLKELPPKSYLEHSVELLNDEREFYEAVWSAAKVEILELLENSETNPLTLFEVLLRTRQICNHQGLVDPHRWKQESSKLNLLMELIEELTEAGHSVLVYSQWTRFLDRIEHELRTEEKDFLRLDGKTTNRGEILGKFQEELPEGAPGKVFLLSLHAGGVGLNLTRADHVIFCDPWWNPYVELQAEDRAYRMGQERPVTIHRFLCENTIEEKIRELQLQKRKLEGDYLDIEKAEGTSNGTSLLKSDIQTLLK